MVTCHRELEAYNATKESSCSVQGFQCAAKKQKQSIEDSESELASSHRSESESDSEPDPDGLSDRITGSPSQENYINVDRPSGSTTIVNAKAPHQLCVHSLSDSSGPLQPPTQPKIHFPTCSFRQGRPRAFNCEWYNSFRWIEYSILPMPTFHCRDLKR